MVNVIISGGGIGDINANIGPINFLKCTFEEVAVTVASFEFAKFSRRCFYLCYFMPKQIIMTSELGNRKIPNEEIHLVECKTRGSRSCAC